MYERRYIGCLELSSEDGREHSAPSPERALLASSAPVEDGRLQVLIA
jgi:hypothetical protein